MKAFMGRFGVPSGFKDCEVKEALGSSRERRLVGGIVEVNKGHTIQFCVHFVRV